MGRKSKATNSRIQNLSRQLTVEEVDELEEEAPTSHTTADLELDDIIAQLGIDILPDMDEDSEDEEDEGLTRPRKEEYFVEIKQLQISYPSPLYQ
jgi:hypothetical protein